MGYLKYISRKFGRPPGAVDYVGEECSVSPTVITVTEYFQEEILEYQVTDIKGFSAGINPEKTYWIRVTGLCDTRFIEDFGVIFGIDNLVLEDVVNTMHMSKIEELDDCVLAIQKVVSVDSKVEELSVLHMATILKGNIVFTLSEKPAVNFIPLNNRLAKNKMKNQKRNADFLFYLIVDLANDSHFSVIESISEKIEIIDETMATEVSSSIGEQINDMNKLLINTKRNIRPLRAFSKSIREEAFEFISEDMQPYFMDLADHLDYVQGELDTYESYLLNIQQKYMNMLGLRTNEIMKTLTIYASIFIPLTFLAGVYGMNFKYFPELDWEYGYVLFWMLCAIVAGGMYLYFRFKKWNL